MIEAQIQFDYKDFLNNCKSWHIDRLIRETNRFTKRLHELRLQGCGTNKNPMKRLMHKRKILLREIGKRIAENKLELMSYSEIEESKRITDKFEEEVGNEE